MIRSTVIVFILLIVIEIAAGQAPQASQVSISLQEVLQAIGNEQNCYFTIEIMLVSGNHRDSIEAYDSKTIPRDLELQQELEWVHERFPDVASKIDNHHGKKVVHVVDSSLESNTRYGMKMKIDGFTFDGTVSELIRELDRKNVGISSVSSQDTRELRVQDFLSRAHVDGKATSIRELLTDSVSLAGRGRIIWVAETGFSNDSQTHIHFVR